MTVEGVLAARTAILERSAAVGGIGLTRSAATAPAAFGAMIERALAGTAASARASGAASAAFERGDTDDIAAVMLARQTASIDFEATLQVRNRLLGAYRDIMNMPI